jgi:hypothetical protein
LTYELEQFKAGIDKGIPSDKRDVDQYIKRMGKHYTSLLQWQDEFKSKFGEYEAGMIWHFYLKVKFLTVGSTRDNNTS